MKKIIFASLSFLAISSFAQENKKEIIEKVIEKKEDKNKKVIEKKITTTVDGKKSKTTIVIDGSKVTINGKPIEQLKETEMELLVEEAMDELREVLPNNDLLRNKIRIPTIENRIKEFRRSFNALPKNKALLGVSFTTNNEGALINSVEDNSAAEKAGLKKNDLITSINNQPINTENSIEKVISTFSPGDEINISYKRENSNFTTKAILTENKSDIVEIEVERFNEDEAPFRRPPMPFSFFSPSKPKLGLKVQDGEDGDGVTILDVFENSVAEKASLQKNDIIKQIDGEAIKSVEDFKKRSTNFKEGDTLKFSIIRNGKTQEIAVKIPKKLQVAEL